MNDFFKDREKAESELLNDDYYNSLEKEYQHSYKYGFVTANLQSRIHELESKLDYIKRSIEY